jgi:hypothetical protein
MGLLDRFKAQPRWKHPDPDIRMEGVKEVAETEQDVLAGIAREDAEPRVRRAAISRLLDPDVLARLAGGEPDGDIREFACGRLMRIAIEASNGDAALASRALEALTDSRQIAQVAKEAADETVSLAAVRRLDDQRAIGSVARQSGHAVTRLEAVARLSDETELASVSIRTDRKDVGLAALDRVRDPETLAQISARAKNKAVSRRARALIQPPPSPEAVPPVETMAATGDPSAVVEQVPMDLAEATVEPRPEPPPLAASSEPPAGDEPVRQAEQAIGSVELQEGAATAEPEETTAPGAGDDAQERRARLEAVLPAAEEAASWPDLGEARSRWAALRKAWAEALGSSSPDEDLAQRYGAAENRLRAREAEARQERERRQRDALARYQQQCAHLEALVAAESLSLKQAERAARESKSLLDTLSTVPSSSADALLPTRQDREDLVARVRKAQSGLYPKLQELREADDWKRWANAEVQERLCGRAEALIEVGDPAEAARQLRELQQEWKEVAVAPRDRAEALWQRFRTAQAAVRARCDQYFAAQATEKAQNLQAKVALCERVEAMAQSTDWIRTAEEIKRIQGEWKTIGPALQEKATWERFRSACDTFFTRRKQDLDRRKQQWSANLALKEALCQRAEALAESTEWDAAAAGIRKLQAEWKTIGPVRHNKSEAIWNRFRAACDRFFERYQHRDAHVLSGAIEQREALCAELEGLVPGDGAETAAAGRDLLARVQDIRRRWDHGPQVTPQEQRRFTERFTAALEGVARFAPDLFRGSDLDVEGNRRRMEELVSRVEKLIAPEVAPVQASPAEMLAAQLREALAANTIGGRVDEDAKWRAAVEDVRQAQASWRRLGPVPPDVAKSLAGRFERACARFFDQRRKGK